MTLPTAQYTKQNNMKAKDHDFSIFQVTFFFLILICLTLMLASCKEIHPTSSSGDNRVEGIAELSGAAELSVSPESLKVTSDAGSVELAIETADDPNLDWEISSEEDWLSFTPASGSGPDTVVITYEQNTLGVSRKTEIMVRSNVGDVTVPIKQTCQREDDPEVNDVIVIGTLVEPDFLSTGQFDLVAIPLDEEGDAILTADVEAEVLIESPNGLTATVPEQQIDEPTGAPLAVALNIDASGSTFSTDPTNARLAGARSLVRVLDASETSFEAAIFRYPPEGDLLQGFTDNLDLLDAAIGQIGSGGGTPTYASLLEVLDYIDTEKPATSFDRSIVLLSDGQPTDFFVSRSDVCARATELSIPIYAIGLGPASDIDENSSSFAVEEMRAVAECSGAAYAGIDPNNVDSSAVLIFNNIGTATTEGSITFKVQVEGEEFTQLQDGDIIQGSITLSSGGESASSEFSFSVPSNGASKRNRPTYELEYE